MNSVYILKGLVFIFLDFLYRQVYKKLLFMENLSQLIKKAQKETKNMEELINKFSPLIRHFASRLPYDRQDATQDMVLSFLQIIHAIQLDELYEQNDLVLLAYLKKAMSNHYINLLGKYSKTSNQLLSLEDQDIQIAIENDFEMEMEIRRLTEHLSEIQRQVISLKYWYGYSEVDIAQMLHITRQAVNRTKNRAINELRKLYFSKE